jgi:DNA adenine methylase
LKTSDTPVLRNAKPFLKWAGGKQQLLSQFEAYFPSSFERYVEPFIGGGAVFFYLWDTKRLPDHAFLFDTNAELINTYRVVKQNIDRLVELLSVHQHKHCKDYYYNVRNWDREEIALSDVGRAARMIYLNKTCYNGLYRVNRKGQFNVPMGKYKHPAIFQEDALRAAHRALEYAWLDVRDFREVLNMAQAGDFFYFDPPYHPLSETARFTNYTAGSFGDDDQRDLAQVFAELDAKGCLCMLSNSYTPLIHDLYKNFRVETVQANRNINSKTSARGSIKEVLVLNY